MSAFEFRLADVGEGIHEVEILAWKVQPGDRVRAFDPLCQVESAKAAVELTSPVAGRIAETRVPVGGTARVGEVLVVIDTEAPADVPAAPANAGPEEGWFGIVGAPPRPVPEGAPREARSENAVRAAPLVRKVARDRGIRLEDVPGSGPEGRVRLADLEAYAARATPSGPAIAAPPVSAPAAEEERVPLQGLRKRIAEHLTEAVRHAPLVTAMDLFDVTDLVEARERLRPAAEREGIKLTYLPFVVKAAVEALRAVPTANAVLDEGAATIVVKRAYNIGIATAVPGGLIVPVVKHADALSVLEIAREIARLVEAARARQSPPADLAGGTFTISSFGGLAGGPLFATPIVNSPEVAILGIGRVEEQPRVVAGAIVPRHCLGVSLTFDHRVLDGEGAGQFMAVLRRYLEQPLELLLRLR
jgi:pyruvate dehydrogenase E2 component (dihydrolipoamide acetyltransferase)